MTPVTFYFDLVSPYSWLALRQARRFADANEVTWDMRPVVYAVLLDAAGLVGPVESDVKRTYTFVDLIRCASRIGLQVAGPPTHPFRSLEGLRVACLFRHEPAAVDLCAALADAAWGQGRNLEDPGVLADVVAAAGLPADGLDRRCRTPEVKEDLRRLTAEAAAAGVFGVPTFALAGELFWGHDRLDHLADRLAGRLDDCRPAADRLRARPASAWRRGTPRPAPGGGRS